MKRLAIRIAIRIAIGLAIAVSAAILAIDADSRAARQAVSQIGREGSADTRPPAHADPVDIAFCRLDGPCRGATP